MSPFKTCYKTFQSKATLMIHFKKDATTVVIRQTVVNIHSISLFHFRNSLNEIFMFPRQNISLKHF